MTLTYPGHVANQSCDPTDSARKALLVQNI